MQGNRPISAFALWVLALLGPCLLGPCAVSASAQTGLWFQEVHYQRGDDPRWANPAFDDRSWPLAHLAGLPTPTSRILWLRASIELPPGEGTHPRGIVVSGLASHELYWDGVLIGSGGVVGASREEEEPGPIQTLHPLPPELATPGSHLVALRLSSWHIGFQPTTWFYSLGVVEPSAMTAAILGEALLPLGALGALLLAGLYFLTLFFLDRAQPSSFLLGLLSFTLAGQMLAEIWRTLFGYSYEWHIVRLRTIAVLASASGLLLVAFLGSRFQVSHRRLILALTAVLVVLAMALPGYDSKTLGAYAITLTCSAGLCFDALRRRLLGARLASAGVLFCLGLMVLGPWSFLDVSLYYGFGGLLACLLITQALQVRKERRDHELARTNALRLELELLKRYLQPHFLMNTLTALAEVFEENPDNAGEVLEALADEIRTLGEVADRRLIPLSQELELCRAHLVVMSMRREQRLELAAPEIDPRRMVPPAIFHTLLENALSHNHYGDRERITFQLQQEQRREGLVYRFLAPLGNASKRPATDPGAASGTGLRYVEARLAEAYGDRWSLTSAEREEFWQTEILIPDGEA